jgi:hypothetical protein
VGQIGGNCGRGEGDQPDNELFAKALGIAEPWFVKEVDFVMAILATPPGTLVIEIDKKREALH